MTVSKMKSEVILFRNYSKIPLNLNYEQLSTQKNVMTETVTENSINCWHVFPCHLQFNGRSSLQPFFTRLRRSECRRYIYRSVRFSKLQLLTKYLLTVTTNCYRQFDHTSYQSVSPSFHRSIKNLYSAPPPTLHKRYIYIIYIYNTTVLQCISNFVWLRYLQPFPWEMSSKHAG